MRPSAPARNGVKLLDQGLDRTQTLLNLLVQAAYGLVMVLDHLQEFSEE